MPCKVVHRCHNAQNDIQNACDPNKLFGECARKRKIRPGGHESQDEHEGKEYDGVGVKRKVLRIVVDAAAIVAFVGGVAGDAEAGDGDEAEEGEDELE